MSYFNQSIIGRNYDETFKLIFKRLRELQTEIEKMKEKKPKKSKVIK